jgi:guanylate kinase
MRISKAKSEMEYENQFDIILVNRDLENTLKITEEIIKSL